MKGLLLKDFYTVTKYCRAFLFIMIVFLIVSCFGNDSVIFIIYPAIFAGMIPTTLFSYDEREKWNITCETLPCSRAQYVSGKYLMGVFFEAAMLVLSAVTQGIRMSTTGVFNISEYLSILGILFGFGLIVPAIVLPLLFRFGAEKGRIAYYIVIGFLCAGTTILMGTGIIKPDMTASVWVAPVACVASVLLFALSWGLSVLFYQKREL